MNKVATELKPKDKFGAWEIVETLIEERGKGNRKCVKCLCTKCNATHWVRIDSLKNGTSTQCVHCQRRELQKYNKYKTVEFKHWVDSLVNKRVNSWTILGNFYRKNYRLYGDCRCEQCKNIYDISVQSILHGGSKKCIKCSRQYHKANLRHGKCDTKTYNSWRAMLTRCRNKNRDVYKYYGGRGITVCERWLKFENFLEDMGEAPEGTTIEKMNNNLGYCKENCKWADKFEQANNRRNNVKITYKDKIYTLKEFAAFAGLKVATVKGRLKADWSLEEILNIQLYQKRRIN